MDILANAGGVVVSYFEWVQDNMKFFWTEEEVNQKLTQVMVAAFNEVFALTKEKNLYPRTAAYVLAVGRVAQAVRIRGIYP
ncbi:MAG: glutamate dehydrogenase [Clostridia bacterium]|nr:glutamate dehydrogenase [Clostridia bacterium]